MIDIKSLHIGSHIAINGKRERVRGLDEDNGLIIRFPAEYVMANEVEPIPITPALLEELEFKKIAERGHWSDWRNYDGIGIGFVGERISATINSTENVVAVANIHYLHELEAYVYLATQTELIKD